MLTTSQTIAPLPPLPRPSWIDQLVIAKASARGSRSIPDDVQATRLPYMGIPPKSATKAKPKRSDDVEKLTGIVA